MASMIDQMQSEKPVEVVDEKYRRASVVDEEILTGDLYDVRYETTKRGLKSRHAQMIALGGTFQKCPILSTRVLS